ncbi:VanW family protein [Paratissierella segnis]|uniref:VanW family protein n=1 Tax=Paratissierella segnis TaxID=2763679 RepID=A0A926EZD3_9FIRM|nr:VanW family protein [Paratissierella segnis]MBC8589189.1 VanW family protein [Paratissierella segnis]
MKKALFIIIPLIILIGGFLGGGYYIYKNEINTNAIYDGITIDGYDVSNKTKSEAYVFIRDQKEDDDKGKFMKLYFEDKSYDISLKDLGYSYDFEKAVNEAYEIGREGNLFKRYKEIRNVRKNNININLEPSYDNDLVLKTVDIIALDLNQDGKDAVLNFSNGKFSISEDKDGRKVDKEQLEKLIADNIYELEDINIPIEITKPKITKAMLGRVNGVIGEFSTSFKGSSGGRIHNIKLSAQSLNNLLIMPGQEISYNKTTGPRQAQSGYKEAPVILNGELTPGMGGGVCQTSTTLYNALLLADLTIVERHPHSIAAAYVPRGQDGAVASGYLDLRFKNDFDFPVYISTKSVGDRVYIYIYGDTKVKDYTVKIEPELVETIPYETKEVFDPNAEPGSRILVQEGRNGYKVRTFKSIIKDGKVIDRKQITFDYYREKDFIYNVGPKPTFNEQPVEEDIEDVVDILLP